MDWLEELQMDTLLQAIEQQLQTVLPAFSVRELFAQLLAGELTLDWPTLLQQVGQVIWQSVTGQFQLLGQLILLAIAFAVLRQLETSFAKSQVQHISGLVIQAVAVLLILQSVQLVLTDSRQAVDRMAEIMQLLLPVQLLLMAGLGHVKTAGLLQPSLLFMVQGTTFFFQTVLLPLITMELLLKMVNSFSDTYRLTNLAVFLRKLILIIISFSMMLFLAILTLQGIGGHGLDRLSMRALKYVTGAAVPVVGGMLSSLLDTLVSGGLVIRNGLGLVGLLVILLLTALPALNILLLYFLYSFAAALLQPLGDSRMIALLEQTAGSFMLLFATVALTGVLFFFMILIVMAASGAAF